MKLWRHATRRKVEIVGPKKVIDSIVERRLIYNQMVINDQELDLVFGALANSTRRGMLIQLSRGEANVCTLAKAYEMSQPAISKHLNVLERAGLVERRKRGREQWVRVRPAKVEAVADWISFYTALWKQQFDAVDEYIKNARKKQK